MWVNGLKRQCFYPGGGVRSESPILLKQTVSCARLSSPCVFTSVRVFQCSCSPFCPNSSPTSPLSPTQASRVTLAGGTQDPWHRTQDTKDTFTPDLASIDGQKRKRLDLLHIESNVCFVLLLHPNFLLFILLCTCALCSQRKVGVIWEIRQEGGNRKGSLQILLSHPLIFFYPEH